MHLPNWACDNLKLLQANCSQFEGPLRALPEISCVGKNIFTIYLIINAEWYNLNCPSGLASVLSFYMALQNSELSYMF